jgi:hypothetical protein
VGVVYINLLFADRVVTRYASSGVAIYSLLSTPSSRLFVGRSHNSTVIHAINFTAYLTGVY